jgi:hypothetical protein
LNVRYVAEREGRARPRDQRRDHRDGSDGDERTAATVNVALAVRASRRFAPVANILAVCAFAW